MRLGRSARPIAASAARTRSRLSPTAFGQADNDEIWHSGGKLDLDCDPARFEPEVGDGGDDRDHQAVSPAATRKYFGKHPPGSARQC